uniref:Uncharacterized protein n=1 Tax=Bos indicus x Bos taurus TaxID=30522 RepID=A0A4W2I942_BOBOX
SSACLSSVVLTGLLRAFSHKAGATWAAGSTDQQTKSASWGVRGTGLTTSGGTQGASAILPRRLTGARSWPCSSTGYESSVFTLHIWGKYTHS